MFLAITWHRGDSSLLTCGGWPRRAVSLHEPGVSENFAPAPGVLCGTKEKAKSPGLQEARQVLHFLEKVRRQLTIVCSLVSGVQPRDETCV